MPINFGLLSNAALTGLGEQERADLQKQATTQFLLGSLLSNDPSMGLRSALSVPEQYSTAQRAITEAQQKAADRQAVAGFQQKYLPTQFNESSPQFTGPVTPDVEARQNELATARAQGLPFNIQSALQDVLRLPPTVQGPIRETITAMQPKVQGNLLLNPNQQIVGGIPSFDARSGTVVTPSVQGGQATFNVTNAPGFAGATARNTLPPLSQNQEYVFDRNGNPTGIRTASGAIQSIGEIESAKAVGQAAGQVEEVIGPDGRTYKVPRSTLLNQPATQPSTRPATGQPTQPGAVSRISPAQEAINQAAAKRYDEFTQLAQNAALTVGDRRRSGEYLYNAAEQLDPNKATEFLATGASYIRAIPGVGDKFDSFVGNVSMFNKTRSEGVLKGLESIKGNANAFEGSIVDKATTGVTDPKFVTKYISALEIANADKDLARQTFLDNYTGDPKGVFTAWQNSPDNPRIYNHPKVNQFLTEQVQSWQRGGSQGAPVLPSGFTAGRSKSTGAVLIKKPDGSTFTVGQ
jgi:hypothetical protein